MGILDHDDFFANDDYWDDGDRAFDRWLDSVASVSDDIELIDWDFEPMEIEFEDIDF